MNANQKTGVILINVGTPDSPSHRDVRRYLKEFLNDPRVIDIHPFFRFMLLYLIILPFRAPRSAKLYRSIWTDQGSPLAVHSKGLVDKVRDLIGHQCQVELAMAYQNPSIESAVKKLMDSGVHRIALFPLFPQYASATTGAVLEKASRIIHSYWNVPVVTSVPAFYAHPGFVDCLAKKAKEHLETFKADHILFSYHGLPQRQIERSGSDLNFRYDLQCYETTKHVAHALGLKEQDYSVGFQSRLGRAKWTEPNINDVLPALSKKGIKRLAVMCPSFVSDCLETVEEIGIGARELWMSLGGTDFLLVPCLNADEDWARVVSGMVANL